MDVSTEDKTLNVNKYPCSIAHSLTDGYAESEQPLGVRGHDEVALASVQGRYHGVPPSLAVLNLQWCVHKVVSEDGSIMK